MNELLADAPKIDGRTMADLLDYFMQLAPDINYYDNNLHISDWQPFFKNSLPFLLASIVKIKTDVVNEKFNFYNSLVKKNPSQAGLQLNLFYTYYNTFRKINDLYLQLKGSGLPFELFVEKLIKNKLKQSFIKFISIANAAVQYYCVKKIDFSEIVNNDVWGVQQKNLFATDESFLKENTNRQRLLALQSELSGLFPVLLEALKTLPVAAEMDLQTSLKPLKEDLQKKHEPHLALIFVFINMFQKLQNDLNSFTRKHLDFFYQDILQIKPQGAAPDKANILFQLQNQVQKYLLKKDTLVKDGKDNNKAEILFSLDDDIVVNKTQVADVRTLFLNNTVVQETNYLEGVYVAKDATKADGIDKEFKDDASFPTVGGKRSKYIAPGTDFFKPYAHARLGFIFASPVLLLNEGRRIVNITIACQLFDPTIDNPDGQVCESNDDINEYPKVYSTQTIFKKVQRLFRKYFVYISMDLINQAAAKGISRITVQLLKDKFLLDTTKTICGQTENIYLQEEAVMWEDWWSNYYSTVDPLEKTVIDELFAKQRVFKILFSGAKDWIEPSQIKRMRFTPLTINGTKMTFAIKMKVIIKVDKPSVTFYNKDNLKEDLNTTQPLVKIELNDQIKIKRGFELKATSCCLNRPVDNSKLPLSFYYFFRNLKVIESTDKNIFNKIFNTGIDVKVCGLKNFIVQNDESVQDVNSPMYPFGTTPKLNANFYIGCEEIFLKKWTSIWVDLNWKDLPPVSSLPAPLGGTRFRAYYNGYQDHFASGDANIVLDEKFHMQIAVLQDGEWVQWKYIEDCTGGSNPAKCQLFQDMPSSYECDEDQNYLYQFQIDRNTDFLPVLPYTSEKLVFKGIKRYDTDTRQSFFRLTLKCQDFQHDRYPFILARQMSALGRLPAILDGAVYFGINSAGDYKVLDINSLFSDIIYASKLVNDPAFNNPTISGNPGRLKTVHDELDGKTNTDNITDNLLHAFQDDIVSPPNPPAPTPSPFDTMKEALDKVFGILGIQQGNIEGTLNKGVVIPNQPWAPIISNMSLDYKASATLEDIDFIHLYPYDGTYMYKEIQLQPTLFPTICDEGTLFLGLKDLIPGENLNILFQLAEATSDSESDPQDVYWHYLFNNTWQPLRNKFEVLNDGTDNLTTSGIIKFSLPENISADNTVMPKSLYWIKASIPKNSSDVSETIGISAQAISVTFTNDDANDKLRLTTPLQKGSIAKLQIADANIKEVNQPYETFGGAVPEVQSQYYVRVSELLRHKGRAIQKFDYERLILQAFPQLFKAKCINHSFALNGQQYINDFPFAPGYVLLAVIPDLNKLKAGNSMQPKVPVSILKKIKEYVQKRTSPFVRFRAMNPRYESIYFSLTVKLLPGKDRNYYKEQLTKDLKEFMAPWSVGDYYKLTFGQCVNRSDIIQFLETRDYIDYVLELKMLREDDLANECDEPLEICPATPRSILIAGDVDVCVLADTECEQWSKDKCAHQPILLNDYCVKDK
jgi:hypothetical protein